MQTLTADEFKKKYGSQSYDQLDKTQHSSQQESNLFDEIKQSFQQGVQTVGQGIEEAKPVGGGGFGGLVTGVGKILGGATQAVTSFAAPLLSRTVGAGINYAGNKLAETPYMQGFGKDTASLPANQETAPEKITGAIANYSNAAGLVGGIEAGIGGASKAAGKVSTPLENTPKASPIESTGPSPLSEAGTYLKGAVRDVTPTIQNTIDHQIAKALDLTPSDLSNIEASTGNQVGRFLADNNLIGTNKVSTQAAIDDFFKQNYEAVRSEIGKVETTYKPYQIPRFTDALKAIQAQVKGTLGLEKVNADIDNLLHKTVVKLSDVQKAKELMDDHFSLYKVTGDVASGVAKEGLANVRSGLKDFIEAQVKKETGADIKQLNNNVSTARSLSDAITTRSPRGLTRANITNRDIMTGLGLTYFGTPLLGLGYVLMKKLVTSPTVRLRVARYLDQLNDAQKLKISEQLQKGKVPADLEKIAAPLDTSVLTEPN